jgi:hypothetical protein
MIVRLILIRFMNVLGEIENLMDSSVVGSYILVMISSRGSNYKKISLVYFKMWYYDTFNGLN